MKNHVKTDTRKGLSLVLALILCLCGTALRAGNMLGVGIHAGLHPDVGNLSTMDPAVQVDPQNSLLVGISMKANYGFLFFRAGMDTTFLLTKGNVLESSSEIEYYKIDYISLPLFAGLNFPIKEVGEFYLGGGMSYFLGSGEIKSAVAKDSISATAIGFGFIAGIQLNITPSIRLYMEWEYLDAKAKPNIRTQTTYTWEDFYVDFSGHRVLLGVMYYLI